MASSVALQYRDEIQEMELSKQITVLCIFAIGGPFFAITNILSYLLDIFMPEGWNDDDIERH